MTDCGLAGDGREDGELEDGEIDDEGIGIEEEKETQEGKEDKGKEKELKEKVKDKGREREEKTHRHSRKRSRKTKEKRRSKKRRRDRQKHHSPSSGSSSDSYDSDYDRPQRTKSWKSPGSKRESNGQSSQHDRDSKGVHGVLQKSPQRKSGDYDKYSDYSDGKYDYEEDDYMDDMSDFPMSKDLSGEGRGRHAKDPTRRANMRGPHKQQQCRNISPVTFETTELVLNISRSAILNYYLL